MKLEIIQEDIDNGMPCKAYHCPIAFALDRYQPGKPWFVNSRGASNGETHFKMSTYAKVFMNKFDRGSPVTPTTIELEESLQDET